MNYLINISTDVMLEVVLAEIIRKASERINIDINI